MDASSGKLSGPSTKVIKNSQIYPYGTTEQFPDVVDSLGNLLTNTAHEYRECSNKVSFELIFKCKYGLLSINIPFYRVSVTVRQELATVSKVMKGLVAKELLAQPMLKAFVLGTAFANRSRNFLMPTVRWNIVFGTRMQLWVVIATEVTLVRTVHRKCARRALTLCTSTMDEQSAIKISPLYFTRRILAPQSKETTL